MSIFEQVPDIKKRAWAEIDLDRAANNYRLIRGKLLPKTKLCCVVKANAYGHSAVVLGKLYSRLGADWLAVSNIEEALQLRQNQITLPILVLGYTPPDCAALLADRNITQCVFSREYGLALAEKAEKANKKVRVHIKLDTGMGRIGFPCRGEGDCIDDIAEVCRSKNLEAEGIFTHFAVADEGMDGRAYTAEQFGFFTEAIRKLEEREITFEIRHCSNSAAIWGYPAYELDMVRAGVVLYGLEPSGGTESELLPVMSLHTVISHVKTLYPGQSVSYGRAFTAEKEMKLATVPIGYADGFRRMNVKGGYLRVHGEKAPIVGRVCMDQLMLDVTRIPCAVGDEVVVFGSDPSDIVEMARINETIHYEILCEIGERIPRAFIENQRIIGWKDHIWSETGKTDGGMA